MPFIDKAPVSQGRSPPSGHGRIRLKRPIPLSGWSSKPFPVTRGPGDRRSVLLHRLGAANPSEPAPASPSQARFSREQGGPHRSKELASRGSSHRSFFLEQLVETGKPVHRPPDHLYASKISEGARKDDEPGRDQEKDWTACLIRWKSGGAF
jgi:hypothetical protein